jgi:phospholipid transport system substrate-binding protein
MKGNKFINCNLLILLLLVLLSSTVRAGTGPVTGQLKATLDQIIKVLNDPSLKTPDKEDERRNILLKLIKKRIDEEAFAIKALGAHWEKRTEKEKQEFVEIFSDLLERTYLKKIDDYLAKAESFSEKNILYVNETVRGDFVIIETKVLINKDSQIPVYYLFKNKKGNWLAIDIAIEGVSLVKNYRAQFNEILAQSSFDELIFRLKSKQQQAETTDKQE